MVNTRRGIEKGIIGRKGGERRGEKSRYNNYYQSDSFASEIRFIKRRYMTSCRFNYLYVYL